MIDISNLSIEELIELQKQIKTKLNSSFGVQPREDELELCIKSFNRLCDPDKTNLSMSKEEKTEGLVYLNVEQDGQKIYSDLFKSNKDALVIAKKHLSLVPVYLILDSLVAENISFIKIEEHFFSMSFSYDGVEFVLRQDGIGRFMSLSGSIAFTDDTNCVKMNNDTLDMKVSSKPAAEIKVELADNRLVDDIELQCEIETMTERLKNKIEALTSF